MTVKLHRKGVGGSLLKLLNSFLTERHISIRLNGRTYKSRRCSIIGLPQGSVLAPLLFILYISDIPLYRGVETAGEVEVDIFKYADDGTVSAIGPDVNDCCFVLQEAFNLLYSWCCKWRLTINCNRNKTEVLVLRTRGTAEVSIQNLPKIKCGPRELEFVRKTKVLGVIIDDCLSFQPHAAYILKRCWYDWYRISNNTNRMSGLNTQSLSLLFNSIVCSKVLYASPVWLSKQMDAFKGLWARVIMKLTGSQYHPERNLAELALRFPPLQIRNTIHITKFILKGWCSDPGFISLLSSIDSTVRHSFLSHMQIAKQWVAWKCKTKDEISQGDDAMQQDSTRFSARGVDLGSLLGGTTLKYSKTSMLKFTNYIWYHYIKHQLPDKPLIPWSTLGNLTPRGSSRFTNAIVMDFVHGHALRFGSFRKSVSHLTTEDACVRCGSFPDTPEHQLFYCGHYDCPWRHDLIAVLDGETNDFPWRILTGPLNEVTCSTFKYYVSWMIRTQLQENEISEDVRNYLVSTLDLHLQYSIKHREFCPGSDWIAIEEEDGPSRVHAALSTTHHVFTMAIV